MKKESAYNTYWSIIDRFNSVNVLVAGDTFLDRFQYGKVERISPEAPVPVFRPTHIAEMPGGAGNAAVNMASLGCKVSLVGRTGKDQASQRLSRLLAEYNIDHEFFRQRNCCTAVKTRLIASNNHILRVDEEQIVPIEKRVVNLAYDGIQEKLADCDIAVLSDYGKGFLTPELFSLIIKTCRDNGTPIIVDPKGSDYSKYAGATLVKPNLKEFSEVVGMRFDPMSKSFRADLICAANKLMASCRIEGLLVTLGEHGMLYVPAARSLEDFIYLPARAREVFDVSGAGDTTVAAIAASLGAGASMCDAMCIANAAAGIVVGKVGTATVSVDELKAELAGIADDPQRKIISAADLKKKLLLQKKQGKRIGFTNGCFDCCHLGHLTSLREARKLCDVLVVGINSDAWIKKHKGDGRPIQDEVTRTTLIAALECVDYVVVFGETTALPLVKLLRPDVIAKEGYALKDWPEGRFVQSIGGDAVILPRVDGYSTTSIAKRIGSK